MKKNSVVIYKNSCALVEGEESSKILVSWCVSRASATGKKAVYASQKVRPRDIILLSEEPAPSVDSCLDFAEEALKPESAVERQVAEVYELLSGDSETSSAFMPFGELFELIRGKNSPVELWGVYCVLKKGFYFEEKIDSSDP